MVLAGSIVFKIVCAPDSRDAEAEVNRILKEHKDSDVELCEFKVAEKYVRIIECVCPKCGGALKQACTPQFTHQCSECRRAFTQEDAEKNTRTAYVRAGNFFIQPIIIHKEK